jgi:hypothetical protein
MYAPKQNRESLIVKSPIEVPLSRYISFNDVYAFAKTGSRSNVLTFQRFNPFNARPAWPPRPAPPATSLAIV